MPEQEEVLSAADRMAQFRRHMVVQESGLEQYLSSLHFSPDPFQVEALEHLALGSSVLVCAPTGAGKTVVGEGATYLARARGKQVYYRLRVPCVLNFFHCLDSVLTARDRLTGF